MNPTPKGAAEIAASRPSVFNEAWTDVYDDTVHSTVRTASGQYVFAEGSPYVREYIIGLHNKGIRIREEPAEEVKRVY